MHSAGGFFFFRSKSFLFWYTLELHEKDPDAWWNTFEVNIHGSFNFFRCVSLVLLWSCPRL